MNRDWLQAVLARDARFDGTFVYGVASTRIFCRPNCPSKRPKFENIALFETVKDAQSAGFRACKRCQPEKWAARGEAAIAMKRKSVATLDVSQRQMKAESRISRLKNELQKGENEMKSQNETEFSSARQLFEAAPQHLGLTPVSYSKGGAGAQIRFGFAACEVGLLMVARTQKGVCAVRLGEEEAALEAQLREEFFAAQIERDDESLRAEIAAVLALLDGAPSNFALTFDVKATAWQWRVWQELQAIPRGETRTYGQLAAQMGRPSAARAVARACATNGLALVYPCHRVVGSDGHLRGFRWNIERKRRLLEHEKA